MLGIKSWKVGVIVKSKPGELVFNALRFGSQGDAVFYGGTLRFRWREVVRVEIQECDEPPNCTLPLPSDRYPVDRPKLA